MSRVAKNPISIPAGIEVKVSGQDVSVKGSKGSMQMAVHDLISVEHADNVIRISPRNNSISANAMSGTMRALLNNLVVGVGSGFSKKLDLVGVGYRAQVQGQALNLTLGFSHPLAFRIPAGITIETPSQTEILIKGMDKQQVGQVAAEIRSYRPVEPYKGKGVRYSNEVVIRKEVKKK